MKKIVAWSVLGAVVVFAGGFGVWAASLPAAPRVSTPAAVGQAERAATVEALRPTRRARPVIAVLGANGDSQTETTDYIVSLGILRRAEIADVVALATRPGPVKLYPALRADADSTIAEFDARHPEGADYVIVPAMRPHDDPIVLAWLKSQAAKGAKIVGVCVGATVVAAAGLLDDKRATTHWYYRSGMLDAHPKIHFVRDRRFVVDGNVVTTTGITASIPAMLTLIEAIGGRGKASAVAQEIGVDHWDARHASDAFVLSRPFAMTVLGNALGLWDHERLGIRLEEGMDEVSLALVADAWSRTYRSRAIALGATSRPVTTRDGLRIWPDETAGDWGEGPTIGTAGQAPAQALDRALSRIAVRYGASTANVVAAQLEYPRPH